MLHKNKKFQKTSKKMYYKIDKQCYDKIEMYKIQKETRFPFHCTIHASDLTLNIH